MIMFEVWRWNNANANGGMRFAFPPYGLRATGYGLRQPGLFVDLEAWGFHFFRVT